MTSPQLEDGYLRIANELYDAILKYPFSKREILIVLAVIRKTYGYGKKHDDISLSQLSEMTGLDKAHVSRTLSELSLKKVLLKQQGKYGQLIGISKNYKNWKGLPKQQRVAKTATGGCQNSNLPLPKQQPQKTTPKDNTKRQGGFKKPLLADVVKYCSERGNGINPQHFIDFYESNGWKVGKNQMKSWQAAVRTWEARQGNVTHLEHNGPRSKPLAH
jgi:phage replication O-like protein O